MSYLVARMQKMKVGNLGGAYRHNERIFENHSNKDIDTSRSHLNYELTNRDRSVSYEKQIKDYVNETKVSSRAIRKDAVLCDEWIITSDKGFFDGLSEEKTRYFFETAKNYFAENYSKSNIAYASVHLDESTPHMHLGVVPMADGKLSSKAMFGREELKKIQEDFPKYMNEHGFELSRGQLGSERKHLSVADYKAKIGEETLNKELLSLGAPRYWHEKENRPGTEEEVAGYESIASLFSEEEYHIREATLEERFKWLDSHRNDLKSDLSRLENILDKKVTEYDEIDSKASEKLSELSELESSIKYREKELKGLESDSERLSARVKELTEEKVKQKGVITKRVEQLAAMSVSDLDRRQVAEELQEELTAANPKLFGGGFHFTVDFVNRLKVFMSDVVEKLEETMSQNEMLRRAFENVKVSKEKLEQRLTQSDREKSNLEKENYLLREENKELKGSEKLLEDIQEVLTESEIKSIGNRLDDLQASRRARNRYQERERNQGPSL